MKRLIFALAVTIVLSIVAQVTTAQEPEFRDARTARGTDRAPVTQTPEMWFYEEQMRRYDDPATMVRQKAEFRAQQRQRRIAAQKWYGFSKARPTVNSTPWGAMYSPSWSSNGNRPYQWEGVGTAVIVREPYRGYR
jgi:hypothetical protein